MSKFCDSAVLSVTDSQGLGPMHGSECEFRMLKLTKMASAVLQLLTACCTDGLLGADSLQHTESLFNIVAFEPDHTGLYRAFEV